MSPQRRTALVSVGAAVALMGIKLGTGLASGSLGLVSEALHSGTDLVAALLTFFAIGVAGRPADRSHPYGHGKAEHLAALAEAGVLMLVSVAVAALARCAARRLDRDRDLDRVVGVRRRRRRDPDRHLAHRCLAAGGAAVHEPGARLERAPLRERPRRARSRCSCGLLAVRAGWPAGDSVAALFVAFLVITAAMRLIRRNVDVLMDRAPADAVRAARAAIAALDPPVEVRRLRLREAAGRTFTDVVIGVSPGAAVGQGHAVADSVEAAVHAALPGQRRRRPRRAGRGRGGVARARARGRDVDLARARDPQPLRDRAARRRPRLAPPQAAGRAPARRGARDRRAGRAGDRRRACRRSSTSRAISSRSPSRRPGARPTTTRPRSSASSARRRAGRHAPFASSTPTRASSCSSRSPSIPPRASPAAHATASRGRGANLGRRARRRRGDRPHRALEARSAAGSAAPG